MAKAFASLGSLSSVFVPFASIQPNFRFGSDVLGHKAHQLKRLMVGFPCRSSARNVYYVCKYRKKRGRKTETRNPPPQTKNPLRPKLLQKILSKIIVLAQLSLQKIQQSLYKANSVACSLANRDKPVAATLQRKCSGGIIFVIITKIITKIIVPRNYFVIVSARIF